MASSSRGVTLHPWEVRAAARLARGGDGDSDSEDDAPPEGEAAATELTHLLVSQLLAGKMSAKTVCSIAYWASRAGARGDIEKLSHRPDAPSGHFQRHLDSVLGTKVSELRKSMYHIRLPGLQTKNDSSRSTHLQPV